MPSKIDRVYDEIAMLTGNRAEMERQRFLIIKAIRALRAVRGDAAISDPLTVDALSEFDNAIEKLTSIKAELWTVIEQTDASIARLTDLAQNGAYNE